jgi:hypothetical protein
METRLSDEGDSDRVESYADPCVTGNASFHAETRPKRAPRTARRSREALVEGALMPVGAAASAKPLVLMNDLEFMRACDAIYEDVERALLLDARRGRTDVVIAAVVLFTAGRHRSVVFACEETGDGEGVALATALLERARPRLEPSERVQLELVRLTLLADGSWRSRRSRRPRVRRAPEHEVGARSVLERLRAARRGRADVRISAAVLISPAGQRHVALAYCSRGDGEARRACSDFLRRVRRLSLLERGERLERLLVRLRLTDAGWSIASRTLAGPDER